jgi:thiamine-phosphate pyrophosphorylase
MPSPCLLCYITDRAAFPGNERARRRSVLEKIEEAARAGVDYIQLREKDLSARELESLAREAMDVVRKTQRSPAGSRPRACRFLINTRTDVALAVGADGVHLRSDDISPEDVRQIWESAAMISTLRNSNRMGRPELPLIGVSSHSPADVAQAAASGATFAVFAPVFEKPGSPATGLASLHQACRSKIPVFALGGITIENAQSCLETGACGIAGIRLFQENDVAAVVKALTRNAHEG